MKVHKYAKYFPILEGEEFGSFVQSIKDEGQLEKIVMIGDEILDGVNRWRACEQLGIEPITEDYEGDDPLRYVIALNIKRRHLNTSQKAMLATEMLPEFEEKAKQRMSEGSKRRWSSDHPLDDSEKKDKQLARDDVAKEFGISGPSVQRAKRVKKEAPDRVEDIIKGKTTVSKVDAELAEKDREEKKDKKTVKQHPKCMIEYLDANLEYKEALKRAIASAKKGLFSPESINFIATRHNQTNDLMSTLEDLI